MAVLLFKASSYKSLFDPVKGLSYCHSLSLSMNHSIMYSLLTFAALFGSAYARPASGTVSSQDAPLSLPSNETALYPPYKFTVPVYTPAQQ